MDKCNKYVAEFIGTFCLVFAGCGAIITNDMSGGSVTHVGVSLTFGLVVTAMIYSFGGVSGAHINPAVTIGFCFAQKFSRKCGMYYILSQICGAICASLLLRLLFPGHKALGATMPAGNIWQSFLLEAILTFILMLVILNVSRGSKEVGIMAGAAIGGTIAFEALLGGPISGASMNPARSLGPAIVSGNLQNIWIYLIAPVIGALVAGPFCGLIQGKECCEFNLQD